MADKANSRPQFTGDGAPLPFAVSVPRWRCRPDGSQTWRRLELSISDAKRLRERAVECGVTVDAWLNVALGLGLDVPSQSVTTPLMQALPRVPVRRPFGRRLRSWQRYLEEQDGPGLADELPEVVLSETALGIDSNATIEVPKLLALTDPDWDLARRCEIRAAGLSISVPAFVASLSAQAAA